MSKKLATPNRTPETPVYCKSCHSFNTWRAEPARDIKDIDGKILWHRYICRNCNNDTIVPVIEVG